MKVVIAIDSFKGSLTSTEAGNSAEEGIKRVFPEAEVYVSPVADGGEGTVEALTSGLGGELRSVNVCGPLGEKTKAVYGIIKETKTAIIEMSAAAGITLVEKEKLNPLKATTYGVGEMIKDAILLGCREFIVGIGGSATNDGGVGMLQALGFGMLDKDGEQIPFGAEGLEKLHRITTDNVISELKDCVFNIACDVENPLCGEKGCSRVYAPQKGADEAMIAKMDKWLSDYAKLTKESFINSDKDFPGAGAAGGMGFCFMSFLNGKLKKGIDLVLEATKLENHIKECDIVITGEGRLDFQTAMGKAPVGIAKIAKKYEKKVFAFAGGVTEDARECNKKGIDAFFPIVRGVTSLKDAMETENAKKNMADTVEQVFRIISFI